MQIGRGLKPPLPLCIVSLKYRLKSKYFIFGGGGIIDPVNNNIYENRHCSRTIEYKSYLGIDYCVGSKQCASSVASSLDTSVRYSVVLCRFLQGTQISGSPHCDIGTYARTVPVGQAPPGVCHNSSNLTAEVDPWKPPCLLLLTSDSEIQKKQTF